MLGAWVMWMSASLVRMTTALIALRRAKAVSLPFPSAREVRLHGWMSVRRTGRHATLVVSEEVRSAGVLGLRAPAIAIAPAMLRELSDSELDQILVHEWAHVQRRDDLGRLCQVLVTAVAGLHPAVWLINRRLHIERETACDDWTVNVTGAPKVYAECLTKVATMGNDGLLVPAASSSSTLRTRVVRLLDRRRNRSTRFTVTSLAVAPVLAAIAMAAASVELVVNRPTAFASENEKEVAGTFPKKVPATFFAETAVPTPRPPAPPAPKKVAGTFSMSGEVEAVTPAAAQAHQPVAREEAHRGLPVVDAIPLAPATALPGSSAPAPTIGDVAKTATAPAATTTPWGAAADAGIALGDAGVAIGDAGVAVGRGSKKGAVATAGFFARMGKSIARSF
jgi:hypothetical protein